MSTAQKYTPLDLDEHANSKENDVPVEEGCVDTTILIDEAVNVPTNSKENYAPVEEEDIDTTALFEKEKAVNDPAISKENDAPVEEEDVDTAILLDKAVNGTDYLIIEVVAPTTLPAGYKLEVDLNGTIIEVTVPKGGVEAGQTFKAPYGNNNHQKKNSKKRGNFHSRQKMNALETAVEHGRWKDGWYDCCNSCDKGPLGCICFTICAMRCPLVAVGLVMQRLKLTCGQQGATQLQADLSCFILSFIGILAPFLVTAMQANVDVYGNDDPGTTIIYAMMVLIYGVILVCVIATLRKVVRDKYDIPEEACDEGCSGCEDCCCALCCTCCTLLQIERQTADETDTGWIV